MTASRVKRTEPKRVGPVRNTMAGPPPAGQGAGAPQDLFTAAGAAVCGVLENGVRTAYAVIDEYMRRGQDAARVIFNDPNRRGVMSDDRGNFPGGFNPGAGYNASNPMAMMAQQWMMMAMQAWNSAMSSFGQNQWPQGMNAYPSGGVQTSSVAVHVVSSGPVEVTANVFGASDAMGFVCDPPRAEGQKGVPLEPPTIGREGTGLRIAVKVGAKGAAGTYRGYIRKRSDGSVAGDITIVVG
jgi:hypothetical protein